MLLRFKPQCFIGYQGWKSRTNFTLFLPLWKPGNRWIKCLHKSLVLHIGLDFSHFSQATNRRLRRIKPMADGPSFFVQETRMIILVQKICPCVISSRTSFVSYKKLEWTGTLFYSVQETCSHVTEMLRRYW